MFFTFKTNFPPHPLLPRKVPAKLFSEKINNLLEEEKLIACNDCGRKNHEICVLWHKDIGRPFVCRMCQRDATKKVKEINPYSAQSEFVWKDYFKHTHTQENYSSFLF